MGVNSAFINLPADELLALTAYGEARNEGTEGMSAVLNVIINRANNSSIYADSSITVQSDVWHGVVLKSKAFSIYNTNDTQYSKMLNMAENFSTYLSENNSLIQAYALAQMAVAGTLEDNTNGADHYFNPYVVLPSWASSMLYLTQIGNHVFYQEYAFTETIRTASIGGTVVMPSPATSPITLVILAGLAYAGYKLIYKRSKT